MTESGCFTCDTNTAPLISYTPNASQRGPGKKSTNKAEAALPSGSWTAFQPFLPLFCLVLQAQATLGCFQVLRYDILTHGPKPNVRVLPSSAIFIWLTLINATSSHLDATSLGYFFTPAKVTSSGSPQHVEPPLLPVKSHMPLFALGCVLCKTINVLTGTMSIRFTTKSSDTWQLCKKYLQN